MMKARWFTVSVFLVSVTFLASLLPGGVRPMAAQSPPAALIASALSIVLGSVEGETERLALAPDHARVTAALRGESVVSSAGPTPVTGDRYEPDNTCAQAGSISTDGAVQIRTFHDNTDEDWVSFQAVSNTTYLVEARVPPTSPADVVLERYDACGGLPQANQDYAFTPDVRFFFQPPADDDYYLRLINHDPDTGGPEAAYHLSVRALAQTASPGALMLVAGRLRLDDPLQRNIHHVTDAVYHLFRAHGYDGDRIYYLATDLNLDADSDGWPDVDGLANRQNLEQAITQWAVDKVGLHRAFTVYLVGHGGYDRFYLDGSPQTISPEEIDAWLDVLEAAAPGVEVNVIVEAGCSGCFIDPPKSVSGPGRVVIASAGARVPTYASQDGLMFSGVFVDALAREMSLYEAFEEAKWAVQVAHPDQTPWLDDDGDVTPNEEEDGRVAQRRGFAYGGTFCHAGTFCEPGWPPYIVWATVGEVKGGEGVIEAEVRDDQEGVLSVWAAVYAPSRELAEPCEVVSPGNLPAVMLLDTDGDGVYRALYGNFDEIGEYRVVVYAVDEERLEGRPKEVKVRTGWAVYLPLILESY